MWSSFNSQITLQSFFTLVAFVTVPSFFGALWGGRTADVSARSFGVLLGTGAGCVVTIASGLALLGVHRYASFAAPVIGGVAAYALARWIGSRL